ncbi:MAG: protein kinase [Candidatus Aureabacteria bacterium]|nr:protein kinase [Candidatus Auribacterota bacterium]
MKNFSRLISILLFLFFFAYGIPDDLSGYYLAPKSVAKSQTSNSEHSFANPYEATLIALFSQTDEMEETSTAQIQTALTALFLIVLDQIKLRESELFDQHAPLAENAVNLSSTVEIAQIIRNVLPILEKSGAEIDPVMKNICSVLNKKTSVLLKFSNALCWFFIHEFTELDSFELLLSDLPDEPEDEEETNPGFQNASLLESGIDPPLNHFIQMLEEEAAGTMIKEDVYDTQEFKEEAALNNMESELLELEKRPHASIRSLVEIRLLEKHGIAFNELLQALSRKDQPENVRTITDAARKFKLSQEVRPETMDAVIDGIKTRLLDQYITPLRNEFLQLTQRYRRILFLASQGKIRIIRANQGGTRTYYLIEFTDDVIFKKDQAFTRGERFVIPFPRAVNKSDWELSESFKIMFNEYLVQTFIRHVRRENPYLYAFVHPLLEYSDGRHFAFQMHRYVESDPDSVYNSDFMAKEAGLILSQMEELKQLSVLLLQGKIPSDEIRLKLLTLIRTKLESKIQHLSETEDREENIRIVREISLLQDILPKIVSAEISPADQTLRVQLEPEELQFLVWGILQEAVLLGSERMKTLFKNARLVCMQMVGMYHSLHQMGVIHGDPKPANILFGMKSGLELIDFGFSRILTLSRYFFPGRAVGTMSLMAPEWVWVPELNDKKDTWSVAALWIPLLSVFSDNIGGRLRLQMHEYHRQVEKGDEPENPAFESCYNLVKDRIAKYGNTNYEVLLGVFEHYIDPEKKFPADKVAEFRKIIDELMDNIILSVLGTDVESAFSEYFHFLFTLGLKMDPEKRAKTTVGTEGIIACSEEYIASAAGSEDPIVKTASMIFNRYQSGRIKTVSVRNQVLARMIGDISRLHAAGELIITGEQDQLLPETQILFHFSSAWENYFQNDEMIDNSPQGIESWIHALESSVLIKPVSRNRSFGLDQFVHHMGILVSS